MGRVLNVSGAMLSPRSGVSMPKRQETRDKFIIPF